MRLLEAGGTKQIGLAVNVDPDEADPAKIEPAELRARFAPTPLVFADNPDDLSSTFAWLREGTSLWEWFLTAVLIALVFEPLLANRLSPKQAETTTGGPTSQKLGAEHKKARGHVAPEVGRYP